MAVISIMFYLPHKSGQAGVDVIPAGNRLNIVIMTKV